MSVETPVERTLAQRIKAEQRQQLTSAREALGTCQKSISGTIKNLVSLRTERDELKKLITGLDRALDEPKAQAEGAKPEAPPATEKPARAQRRAKGEVPGEAAAAEDVTAEGEDARPILGGNRVAP